MNNNPNHTERNCDRYSYDDALRKYQETAPKDEDGERQLTFAEWLYMKADGEKAPMMPEIVTEDDTRVAAMCCYHCDHCHRRDSVFGECLKRNGQLTYYTDVCELFSQS